jgi:hypothetical protein
MHSSWVDKGTNMLLLYLRQYATDPQVEKLIRSDYWLPVILRP